MQRCGVGLGSLELFRCEVLPLLLRRAANFRVSIVGRLGSFVFGLCRSLFSVGARAWRVLELMNGWHGFIRRNSVL